jgi:hypothetical protein
LVVGVEKLRCRRSRNGAVSCAHRHAQRLSDLRVAGLSFHGEPEVETHEEILRLEHRYEA